jgi:putative Mg2+ transporter-C (MgtC) family protein
MDPIVSLLLSVGLAGIIGIEREVTHKPAGLRTHMLVSLGSCLFTLMSPNFGGQPAQIAGGVVAGIGFIGAGEIWADKDRIRGITTAASLWSVAAIGLACGAGEYMIATVAAILAFVILTSKFLLERVGIEHKSY